MHHAFVIEAAAEEGVAQAKAHTERELSLVGANNPDIIVREYGLLSIEDARQLADIAGQAPLMGERKAIICSAQRLYHEAQNALLKTFEEPPDGTFLYLVVPSLGSLLPTLHSRVLVLGGKRDIPVLPEIAMTFMAATKEKRSALIKKLTSGKDEDERRENRDEALAIVNGVEAAAYARLKETPTPALGALLSDTAAFRSFLYERSAPVRMILEHLSLVLPRNLL